MNSIQIVRLIFFKTQLKDAKVKLLSMFMLLVFISSKQNLITPFYCVICRKFVFFSVPQIQYKNPWVQIMMFKNMTPSPFLRFYLGKYLFLSLLSSVLPNRGISLSGLADFPRNRLTNLVIRNWPLCTHNRTNINSHINKVHENLIYWVLGWANLSDFFPPCLGRWRRAGIGGRRRKGL